MNTKKPNAFPLRNKGPADYGTKDNLMAKLSNQFSAPGRQTKDAGFPAHRRDTFAGEPKFSEGRTTIRLWPGVVQKIEFLVKLTSWH